jgi:hypothetical protein
MAWPSGRHDAEAAFTLDGKLHLVTKDRGGGTAVYRFDALTDGVTNVPAKVADLDIEGAQVTGATAHPDRREIVLLSYFVVLVYPADSLGGKPARVTGFPGLQSEGAALAGDLLVITNEQEDVFAAHRFLDRE